jgi:hypothetical protein
MSGAGSKGGPNHGAWVLLKCDIRCESFIRMPRPPYNYLR